MLNRTHVTVTAALGAGVLLLTRQPVPVTLTVLTGLTLGAQTPDIDKAGTAGNQALGPVGPLLAKLGHRTWTHSIWAVLLLTGLTLLLPKSVSWLPVKLNLYLHWLIISFTLGYFAHLVEDNFSRQGICWFYPFTHYAHSRKTGHPFKKRPFHWWYYQTGGRGETLIRGFARLALTILLIALFIQAYGF